MESASGLPTLYHGNNSLARDNDSLSERHGNGPLPPRENATLIVSEAFRGSDRSVTKLADLLQGRGVPQLNDPILILRSLSLIRGQLHLTDKAKVAVRAGLVRTCLSFQNSSVPTPQRVQSALMLEMMLRVQEGQKALLESKSKSVNGNSNTVESSALRLIAKRAEEDESNEVRDALANSLASFCAERSAADEFLTGNQGGAQALAYIMRGLKNGNLSLLKPLISLANASPLLAPQAFLAALAPEAILSALEILIEGDITIEKAHSESEQDLFVIDMLSLLRSMCALDSGKEACFRAGLVPYATLLLQSSNSNIREITIGIVALMATLLPAKRALLAGDPHQYVLPYLNLLAFDADSPRLTSATTVQAIRALSEVADGRLAFLHALINDPQAILRIFGTSACADLVHILDLKTSSFDDRSSALSAIGYICKSSGSVEKLADCVGVLPLLISISFASTSQSQSSERLRDLSNRIISSSMKSIATQLLMALADKFVDLRGGIIGYCEKHKLEVPVYLLLSREIGGAATMEAEVDGLIVE